MTITSLEDLISTNEIKTDSEIYADGNQLTGTMNVDAVQKKMESYWETATPNQVIQEFEDLGVEFIDTSLPDYLLKDPQIVGYPDEETQNEIYDWVLDGLPKSNYSIKDLGCGRGDLFGRINNPPEWVFDKPSNIDYFGIELNPNLYNVAKQKYPDIQVFNNNYFDISIESDYTVVIGTLGDDMGLDKWENFNKTLNWAISNTKQAIIFVLQRDCYGSEGYLDYPFTELFNNLGTDVKFVLDNSKLEDIYKLTVHIGGHN